ncbi:TIGR02444 family protein [Shewanella sp. H8]|uniref:TIGR02444 family protein n=1 Tax=Shewanella sp. H8 TaxID=3342676 RepID=UPI0033161093
MSHFIHHQMFSHTIWHHCEQSYSINPEFYIRLQDSYQVNINILLLAQYLDQQHYVLMQQHWETLTSVVEKWEANVLQPYRRLRRITKVHLANDEYQKMLDVELIMERKSQNMLLQKLNLLDGETVNSDHCGPSNIQHYLSLFGLNEAIMTELNPQGVISL